MTKDKNIYFRNIYYMLSYAFLVIKEEDRKRIEGESFDNLYELMAKILFLGMDRQIRRGIHKQFEPAEGELATIKGKLLFGETTKQKAAGGIRVNCQYDEFTEDNPFNRIVKSTIEYLIHIPDLSKERKGDLIQILPYLSGVRTIDFKSIQWKSLVYQRNNGDYRLIIGICRLIIEDMILSTEEGAIHAKMFSDEHMNLLYERFLRNYYRKEHPEVDANASKIKWALDSNDLADLMPEMQTDVTLTKGEKKLIIDAKYYAVTLQFKRGKWSFISAHLYQIHTYVQNADKNHTGNVSGVVLYAQPENVPEWDSSVKTVGGNRFAFRLLNLNTPFSEIRHCLDSLIDEFL